MLEQEELSPTMVDTMEKHRNNVVTQQMVNEGWGGGVFNWLYNCEHANSGRKGERKQRTKLLVLKW